MFKVQEKRGKSFSWVTLKECSDLSSAIKEARLFSREFRSYKYIVIDGLDNVVYGNSR